MAQGDLKELARLIGELKELATRASQLSTGNPAAERNLYAVLRHIEMLEIEISDPVRILHGDPTREA